MTTAPMNPADRLLELLADRAVEPLTRKEEAELDALLRSTPDVDTDGFDLAAAAADLAMFGIGTEPMPEALRVRVSELGREWCAPRGAVQRSALPSGKRRERMNFALWTGWLAAAAAIVLAFAGWWTREQPVLPPADGLRLLRSKATDVVTCAWTAGPSDSSPAASGEVIWSPGRQEGYMVFRNMRPNDPAAEQYQLWIFDKERDERYPVDGGVFDVTASGECIVPIHPAVRVKEATLFAVTIERPGGVVVSDRTRLPLLAPVKPAG